MGDRTGLGVQWQAYTIPSIVSLQYKESTLYKLNLYAPYKFSLYSVLFFIPMDTNVYSCIPMHT